MDIREPHTKHLLQHQFYCCVRVLRALSRNGTTLLLVAYLLQDCLPSRSIAKGLHVTILFIYVSSGDILSATCFYILTLQIYDFSSTSDRGIHDSFSAEYNNFLSPCFFTYLLQFFPFTLVLVIYFFMSFLFSFLCFPSHHLLSFKLSSFSYFSFFISFSYFFISSILSGSFSFCLPVLSLYFLAYSMCARTHT